MRHRRQVAAGLIGGYDTYADALPPAEYAAWQRDCLDAMMRISEDGAIFYKWRVQNGRMQDRHDIVARFPVRQVIIWQRNGRSTAGTFCPPTR